MSTEVNESIESFVVHDDIKNDASTMLSVNLQRQNLAGGTGVFSNFFEELAEPNTQPPNESNKPLNSFIQTNDVPHPNQEISSLHRFYAPCSEDDDLKIIDHYRMLVNRCHGDPSCQRICTEDCTPWDYDMGYPPPPAGLDYFLQDQSELEGDLCLLSYAHRCKPPKVLAGRFLLGETIGRGSYGKVKDAIDLITLKRHAIKIVSKLGVRKIPGGWAQALSEAAVMRRLPANRHVVSLACALLLDNPERMCFVMEHCLGSVHDLQAAGVPSVADGDDDDVNGDEFSRLRIGSECQMFRRHNDGNSLQEVDDTDDFLNDYNGGTGANQGSIGTKSRSNSRRSGLFRGLFQPVSGVKVSGKLKLRKISNVEGGFKKKKQALQLNQQPQQQFRRLPEAQAHAYFLQLIDGLHFLHNNGVIHRDIKPANLLLTLHPGCGLSELNRPCDVTMEACNELDENSTEVDTCGFLGRSLTDLLTCSRGWLVKLTDFGVSASLSSFDSSELVAGGQTTPAVQTPEVARGVQSLFVGSKLDVYSAGVTLYFMLIGRVPFSCHNVLQIFEAIAQGDYTIPGHVSSNAASLIRKMMCKDPKKRFTLSQVSRHPWVTTAPPRPLLLSQVQQMVPTVPVNNGQHSKSAPNQPRQRGVVCWLEPLVYLRRPNQEYALPHIDDSGARIYNETELCSDISIIASMNGATSKSQNADDEYDPFASGVAPLSVVDRLQILLNRSDIVDPLAVDSIIPQIQLHQEHLPQVLKSPLPPELQSHELESLMANLDLSSNPTGSKMRYNSDALNPFQYQHIPSAGLHSQCGNMMVSDSVVVEPPASPQDLPISTPSPCILQAGSFIADDDFVFDFSPTQHFSPPPNTLRHSVDEKQCWEHLSSATAHSGSENDTLRQQCSAPVFSDIDRNSHDTSSRGRRRRMSQWFSSSVSSLRRRLRHLRRHDSVRETSQPQQLTTQSTDYAATLNWDPVPPQGTSGQDAADEGKVNDRPKRRRWRATFRQQLCGLSTDIKKPSM